MRDKPIIVAGLAVFLALATFPIWYTLGLAGWAPPPDLEPPFGAPRLFDVPWSAVRGDSEGDVDWRRLQEEFKRHQVSLPDGARLVKGEQGGQWDKWRIVDADRCYLAVKDGDELDVYQGECVEKNMVTNHMSLLKNWREAVVRDADKSQIDINGTMYDKSLTKCCMKCHTSRERFCARCHEYTNVLPLPPLWSRGTAERAVHCWGCHVEPKGN